MVEAKDKRSEVTNDHVHPRTASFPNSEKNKLGVFPTTVKLGFICFFVLNVAPSNLNELLVSLHSLEDMAISEPMLASDVVGRFLMTTGWPHKGFL